MFWLSKSVHKKRRSELHKIAIILKVLKVEQFFLRKGISRWDKENTFL